MIAVGGQPALAPQLHEDLLAIGLLAGDLKAPVDPVAIAARVVEQEVDGLRHEHRG